MRYLVVLMLIAGCASRPPQGGWMKANSQPGELERDYRECYGESGLMGKTGLGRLGRQLGGADADKCMRERGWM